MVETSHDVNNCTVSGENEAQVSQTNVNKCPSFLYNIDVDALSCSSIRLYIFFFLPQFNKIVPMKIDTGSDISICPTRLVADRDTELQDETMEAIVANGSAICLDKSMTLALQCKNFSTQHKFYLSDDIHKCLLGLDFLLDHKAVIDAKNRVLFLNGEVIPLIADPSY